MNFYVARKLSDGSISVWNKRGTFSWVSSLEAFEKLQNDKNLELKPYKTYSGAMRMLSKLDPRVFAEELCVVQL